MTIINQFIIHTDDDGIRIDRWFKRHAPGVSHGEIQKASRKGLIRLDGKKAKPDDVVQSGQELIIKFIDLNVAAATAKQPKPLQGLTEDMMRETQSWVIWKNAHCIAINKPAGIAVQGGSGVKDHVDGRLDALRFDLTNRPKLVHRLDKDTSGVMLLARSTKAAADISKALATKKIQKIYWALIVGVPAAYEGEIESGMQKSGEEYEKMAVDDEGKNAITHYRIIEPLAKRMALVELKPITGRTHQLRVHMAELGTPILGDGKYGGGKAFIDGLDLPKQLHLHARQLIVPHLYGGLDIVAPLASHMKKSFKLLGLEYS